MVWIEQNSRFHRTKLIAHERLNSPLERSNFGNYRWMARDEHSNAPPRRSNIGTFGRMARGQTLKISFLMFAGLTPRVILGQEFELSL